MTKCSICNDSGINLYRHPSRGVGQVRMLLTPTFCQCDSGDKAVRQYEQNLKEGRAGMHGLYPTDTGSVT